MKEAATFKIRTTVQKKMIISISALLIAAISVIVGASMYVFFGYMDRGAEEQAVQGMNGLNSLLEMKKQDALRATILMAEDPRVISAVQNKDTVQIAAVLSSMARHEKIDFVTVTDEQGIVLARTHEQKKGDSVLSQANVKSALNGVPLAAVEQGTVVKLSAWAGAPVKDSQGKVIGVISAGYLLGDDIVDRAKSMFNTDVTLFAGDTRIATTVIKDGQRAVGTKLDKSIAELVLEKGQMYIGKANILGMNYITAYMPLVGPDNKPVGIVFAGKPLVLAEEAKSKVMQLIGVLTAIALFLALGAAILLARNLTKPLRQLAAAIEVVVGGDLTRGVNVDSRDEIGLLAHDFNKMVEYLRNLINQINDSVRKLSQSSEEFTASVEESAQAANQVAQSITDVAQAADDQARDTDQTLAVVQHMSREIEQVAKNAGVVAEVSDQTSASAQAGSKAIGTAVDQMQNIKEKVADLSQVIAKLGTSSNEIGQIVEVIAGIAGQTNLLALNAAIEAARAGEQGRGFAVVAEEVRKLAEQSQEAAKRITQLISDIQTETKYAVSAMEDGTREVRRGTEVVNDAGSSFARIVELINQMSGQVHGISGAVVRMANDSGKVLESIQHIKGISARTADQTQTVSAATEQQSAAMQQLAATSQELSQLAQELKRAISYFKV